MDNNRSPPPNNPIFLFVCLFYPLSSLSVLSGSYEMKRTGKQFSRFLFSVCTHQIATRWPKRTYLMCTLERARNVLMLMGIIVVCLDINHFWTFGVPKPGYRCM